LCIVHTTSLLRSNNRSRRPISLFENSFTSQLSVQTVVRTTLFLCSNSRSYYPPLHSNGHSNSHSNSRSNHPISLFEHSLVPLFEQVVQLGPDFRSNLKKTSVRIGSGSVQTVVHTNHLFVQTVVQTALFHCSNSHSFHCSNRLFNSGPTFRSNQLRFCLNNRSVLPATCSHPGSWQPAYIHST